MTDLLLKAGFVHAHPNMPIFTKGAVMLEAHSGHWKYRLAFPRGDRIGINFFRSIPEVLDWMFENGFGDEPERVEVEEKPREFEYGRYTVTEK